MTPKLAQAVPRTHAQDPVAADSWHSRQACPLAHDSVREDKGEMGSSLLFIKLAFLFPLKLKRVVDHVLTNPN